MYKSKQEKRQLLSKILLNNYISNKGKSHINEIYPNIIVIENNRILK